MKESSKTVYVGLDVHKESIAVQCQSRRVHAKATAPATGTAEAALR